MEPRVAMLIRFLGLAESKMLRDTYARVWKFCNACNEGDIFLDREERGSDGVRCLEKDVTREGRDIHRLFIDQNMNYI